MQHDRGDNASRANVYQHKEYAAKDGVGDGKGTSVSKGKHRRREQNAHSAGPWKK